MAITRETIAVIQREYKNCNRPWFLGYSGEKDSSALLKLVFLALLEIKERFKPVTVIYCDTGVEIPVVRQLVLNTLNGIEDEARRFELPIQIKVLTPEIKNRYFVKVIGRGYPPPSNKFRWCTDRLRIDPVKKALSEVGAEQCIVLLGIRRGESQERDKTITRHETDNKYYFRQADNQKIVIFSPIVDYSVRDVWATIGEGRTPKSIAPQILAKLYWQASGECPIIRDPKGTPCGKGRFGCWTCTVIRKDQAVRNLVAFGYWQLAPLLEFRNWLISVRDKKEFRCRKRRNGIRGMGPFTLGARREILKRLLAVQKLSRLELITREEVLSIRKLWHEDLNSPSYCE